MTLSARETLFALASAPGRAAIAVWRISGPDTADAVRILTRRALPAARQAVLRRLFEPVSNVAIDDALLLWFPGPASFTGEDSAELHTHGGRAVADAVGAALSGLPGLRAAEPGEFSRRAFLNGKLDLTEAEAIADLTVAETEAQRRQALAQAQGGLSALYDKWRESLLRLRAHLDGAIEFPDEDIGYPLVEVAEELDALREAVARHLADARRGERLRDGLTVAVVGAPNAGKSSLVNALSERDVAIVSPEAGTTRDAIEVHLDLGGNPVTLVDTAGLREAAGAIEAEGIARARARAEAADLVLVLFDATLPPDATTLALLDERSIAVWNKADLKPPPDTIGGRQALSISTKTGIGVDALVERISNAVNGLLSDSGGPPPTRARHRTALVGCVQALDAAKNAPAPELSAEELRRAADELGRLTGRIDIEEMLDSIFRDFCIGK